MRKARGQPYIMMSQQAGKGQNNKSDTEFIKSTVRALFFFFF